MLFHLLAISSLDASHALLHTPIGMDDELKLLRPSKRVHKAAAQRSGAEATICGRELTMQKGNCGALRRKMCEDTLASRARVVHAMHLRANAPPWLRPS